MPILAVIQTPYGKREWLTSLSCHTSNNTYSSDSRVLNKYSDITKDLQKIYKNFTSRSFGALIPPPGPKGP